MSETHETFTAIGQEGGTKALALVATIMESNARSYERQMASLYEGERAAHEQTKRRLRAVETQLAVVRDRFTAMLFNPPSADELGGES